MISSSVGKRYARALYELAEEKKETDRVSKALRTLADAWDTSAELQACIQNPLFSTEEKRKVIGALGRRVGAPHVLVNTLCVLADRRRLGHLQEIADAFDDITEHQSGSLRAEIITAAPLPETYFKQLEKTLEAATGKKVHLVHRQDPSLIGGVVTKVGGTVFDGSIKNRLRGLREELLHQATLGAAGHRP